MIRVVQSGRNPTVRYLHRTHRISIAALHEIVIGKSLNRPVECRDTSSNEMAADIFTKSFTDKTTWLHAIDAIGSIGNRDIPSKTAQKRVAFDPKPEIRACVVQ